MINNLSYLPPLGNSDHICIEFNLVCYSEQKKSDNVKYNIRAANFDLMRQSLSNVDWASLLNPLIDNAWSLFKSIFQNIIDDCIPTYKPREKKNLYTNSDVFTLKKKKNKLRKKYLLTHSASDLSNFKSVNNQLRSLTRNLKKDYERQLAHSANSNPKAFWSYVNSKMKIRPVISELFCPDGSSVNSDDDMAALFNNYFSSVFTSEDTTTIPTTYPSSAPPITDSIDITPEIVLSKITNLQNSNSPGPDGWPIQVIKAMGDFISVPLSIIFNKSFNSGFLPQDWKCTHVTPIVRYTKRVHEIWFPIIDQSI